MPPLIALLVFVAPDAACWSAILALDRCTVGSRDAVFARYYRVVGTTALGSECATSLVPFLGEYVLAPIAWASAFGGLGHARHHAVAQFARLAAIARACCLGVGDFMTAVGN